MPRLFGTCKFDDIMMMMVTFLFRTIFASFSENSFGIFNDLINLATVYSQRLEAYY